MLRLALLAAVATVATASADDPADIQRVLDDQIAAWNKGDLDGFMKGYWKSKDLTFASGKEMTRGWDETMARYKKRYRDDGKEMGELAFTEIEVKLLADGVAQVTGKWRLKLSKESPEGRFTLIVKKLADGWRIVHDHTSA